MPSIEQLISIFSFTVILGLLVLVHELGHFIMAKRAGVRVEVFSLGLGPKIATLLKRSDTEYIISLFPFGGYVKLAGENWEGYKGNNWEYLSKPINKRAKILAAGSLFNYIFGFLCLWLVFCIGYPNLTTKIGGFVKGMPAETADLQALDKILSVDNQKVLYWDDMQKAIQDKEGGSVNLLVQRKDEVREIKVPIQRKELTTPWGSKKTVSAIGIVPAGEFVKVRHGPLKALKLSVVKLYELTRDTYKGVVWMLLGKMSVKESVIGPVGIFFGIKGAISAGISAVLYTMAIISASLAIVNLLPIPVLDGGHLVVLLLERMKGRDFIKRFDTLWARLGLTFTILIILFAVFVSYNDMIRFGVFDKIIGWFPK